MTKFRTNFNVLGELNYESNIFKRINQLKSNTKVSLECQLISHVSKRINSGKLLYLTILYDGSEFIQITEWDKSLFKDINIMTKIISYEFLTTKTKLDNYYIKCNNNQIELETIDNKSSITKNSEGNINDLFFMEVNSINPVNIIEKSMINMTGKFLNYIL